LTTAPRFFEDSLTFLKEHAERYFALNLKKEDGSSEADSLTRALSAVSRRTDSASKQQRLEIEARLDLPPMPEEFTFAWGSFVDLQSTRGSNGFSSNPITYLEIEAYIRLSGRVLLPHEIRAIKVIDTAFLEAQADLAKAARAAKDASKKSEQMPAPKRSTRRG
jgi:hypothetical protein